MTAPLVLMYHAVCEPPSERARPLCCPPRLFAAHLDHIARSGRRVVPLARLVQALGQGEPLPPGSLAITFDDGYRSVLEQALPLLERHGFTATVFAVADRVGRDNRWSAEAATEPMALLEAEELRLLAQRGISVGCHSATHPRLTGCEAGALHEETTGARRRLEALLGQPVLDYAYPYGDFDPRVAAAVREAGFRSACSTRSGFVRAEDDLYALRRLDIGPDGPRQFQWKLDFGATRVSAAQVARYYGGRALARLIGARQRGARAGLSRGSRA